jgi:hypothetical protein
VTAVVFGTPAASLKSGQAWAKNDAVIKHGAAGEMKTAALLNALPDGYVVFHDLRMPMKNISANIDHAVLCGKHLILIDSKVWAGGFYWSFRGKNFRDLKHVDHISKKTMQMGQTSFTALLRGTKIHRPVVAVWPSSTVKTPTLFNPFVPSAQVLHGDSLIKHIVSSLPRRPGPTDPVTVNQLKKLLINP